MKKLAIIFMSLACAVSLCACGGNTEETTSAEETTTVAETTAQTSKSEKSSEIKENVGEKVQYWVYGIEPTLKITSSIPTASWVGDDTQKNYIAKIYTNIDKTELFYMNISGEDYVKYFPWSSESKVVASQTFYLPHQITAQVEVSENIVNDLEEEIGSNKALVFKSHDSIKEYKESKAVEFSSAKVGDAAYQKDIIQIEPESVIYSSAGVTHDILFAVFKATLSDATTMYVAITNDEYVTNINPGGNEFSSSFTGAGGGDGMVKLSNATFYGFAESADVLLKGLSTTTGEKILVVDHMK